MQKLFYFYSPEGLSMAKHTGAGASVLLRAGGRALVQRDDGRAALYATDPQGSVLGCSGSNATNLMHYTAYGWDSQTPDVSVLLRFAGQRKDPLTGHYLLGDGYRAFTPGLMRFSAPDSLSPFGDGGLNAYCYCKGDPVNNVDPSGHLPLTNSKVPNYPPDISFLQGGVFTDRWALRSLASHVLGNKAPGLKTLGVKKAMALDGFDSSLADRVKHAKRNKSWNENDVHRLEDAAAWFQGRANRFELTQMYHEKIGATVEAQAARDTMQEALRMKQWVDGHLKTAKRVVGTPEYRKRKLFNVLPFSRPTHKVPNIRDPG
nr:RHS repeat-associated core domain-containing protein [Pseudomonas alloputida]